MANYPYVSPQDENSQYLASILQQYKPGTLGNTATIGNPQGQQDYASQLAQALAEMDSATKQQGRAEGMQGAKYIDNSGLLGVAAVLAQQFAGKKMDEKASKKYEDASMRAMTAKDVLDEAKAERAAAKALKATQDERKQRGTDADQFGLTPDERKRYVLTGNLPNEVRDRVQAVQGQDGFVAANLDRGTWSRLREEGSQSQQLPPNVNVRYQPDEGVDPEQDRKIFDALVAQDMQRPAPTSMDEHVDAGMVRPQQQGGALMPYKDPAIAQRQAMADGRADESLWLARRAADRADSAETRAADAARRQAEAEQRKLNAPNTALAQWDEARTGLEQGLAGSETGPIMGRIPAFTTDQQIAEGAVAATAPILKQLFRTAGEGTFTDKDQDLLMRMVPTRTDTPEARQSKIENIDRIIRAKLGAGSAAAPAAQPGRVLKYNPQTGEFE